jgi:hypothetical protein
MSLSDLASLGSFVSGIAVLASLVFLFFQMRQMTEQVKQAERNQQAVIQQARSTRNAEFNIAIAASPELTEASLKVYLGADLTMHEWFRYNVVEGAYYQHCEDSFYQHKHGLLSGDAFHGFENTLRVVVARPGARLAWRIVRPRFHDDFVEYMDKLIANTPVTEFWIPSLLLERWKADMAAEVAAASRPPT